MGEGHLSLKCLCHRKQRRVKKVNRVSESITHSKIQVGIYVGLIPMSHVHDGIWDVHGGVWE